MYHSTKANIVVYGIIKKENERCTERVNNFFRKMLKIKEHIPILVAHRMGDGEHSPIVAKLVNHTQKGLIFKNVGNIKGVTNKNGDFFRVTDQLTGTRAEGDRRKRDVVRDNNKLQPPEKLSLKKKKGTVYREENENWIKYESLVVPPNISDILCWSPEVEKQMYQLYEQLTASVMVEQEGSRF